MIRPDNDDYNILVRVVNYIQVNIGPPLIMSIKNSVNIKRYVDAAFAVHKDMRSHTGVFITMRTVGSYVPSEAKLFEVDDILAQVIYI